MQDFSEAEICSFCEDEIETLTHPFLECEVLELGWNVMKTKQVYFHLSPVQITVGKDVIHTLNTTKTIPITRKLNFNPK